MNPIRKDTEALSLPEGRRVGQPGHQIALEYIGKRMAEEDLSFFAGDSFRLAYKVGEQEFCNLAGVIPGSDPEAMPILLGAHYDGAVDGPCSDDNAASVAVILSLCRELQDLRRTVIVVFFDAEEPPYFHTKKMGSCRFQMEYCRSIEFASVVILDAIAHDFKVLVPVIDALVRRLRQFIFIIGSESHSNYPGIVERITLSARGLRLIPTLNRYIPDTSDHMPFRKAGQPYLFISRGRGQYTHTMKDDLEWINWKALDRVAEMTLKLLRELDAAPLEVGREPFDPWKMEIRLLRRAAGSLLHLVLPFLGTGKVWLSSRADLDRVAEKLNRIVRL